jgi:hypothetical protein
MLADRMIGLSTLPTLAPLTCFQCSVRARMRGTEKLHVTQKSGCSSSPSDALAS